MMCFIRDRMRGLLRLWADSGRFLSVCSVLRKEVVSSRRSIAMRKLLYMTLTILEWFKNVDASKET